MKRAMVSHPHSNANALGVALGLDRAGRLATFACGVGASEGTLPAAMIKLASRRFGSAKNRIFPRLSVRAHPLSEMLARGVGAVHARVGLGLRAYDAMYVAHDARVSTERWPSDVDGVYAYEDGALLTFTRARRRALPRVWDLPLPHYATLERMWAREQARFPDAMGRAPRTEPRWKKERKDKELELATHVSVASAFTRSSLMDAGCDKPITVIPYGFPVEQFPMKRAAPSDVFTVLAVGSQNLRKGTPYLLEAFRAAFPNPSAANARLVLVGPLGLSEQFLAPYREHFEHVPHQTKAELGARYREADLLAFPTLGDGFGLVMQEAMCSGTPVLTTSAGGGPECITDGVDGFLVEGANVDALVDVLRRAHRSRDALARMGVAARARAEAYTWEDAGRAIASYVAGV